MQNVQTSSVNSFVSRGQGLHVHILVLTLDTPSGGRGQSGPEGGARAARGILSLSHLITG